MVTFADKSRPKKERRCTQNTDAIFRVNVFEIKAIIVANICCVILLNPKCNLRMTLSGTKNTKNATRQQPPQPQPVHPAAICQEIQKLATAKLPN